MNDETHPRYFKKILCCKTIKHHKCNYQNKCMFAHSLDEQKKEPMRATIHDLITGTTSLKDIDIFTDKDVFSELMIHTKLCKKCVFNACAGGWNCKFGACVTSHLICSSDLLFGNCLNNVGCPFGVHLTKRGLIPYNTRALTDTITSHYVINENEEDENNCVNYHYKINALSVNLNKDTVKTICELANATILE